jgi:hypothetical protein
MRIKQHAAESKFEINLGIKTIKKQLPVLQMSNCLILEMMDTSTLILSFPPLIF